MNFDGYLIDKEMGFRFCIGLRFSVKGKAYTVDSISWSGPKLTMVGFTDGEKKYQKPGDEMIKLAKEKVIIPL